MERIVGLCLVIASAGLYFNSGNIAESQLTKGIGAAAWPKVFTY